MKSIIFIFWLLCGGYLQLHGQIGKFEFVKGDTVFWSIKKHQVGVDRYVLQAPLYVVGTMKCLYYDYIDVTPLFFVSACSVSSEEWVKSPQITIEKQSYLQEVEYDDVWDIQRPLIFHYRRKAGSVNPWTPEVEQMLTKGQYVSKKECSKVVAINTRKPTTR